MVGMSSAAAAFDVQPRCDTAVIVTLDATLPSAIRTCAAVPPSLMKEAAWKGLFVHHCPEAVSQTNDEL